MSSSEVDELQSTEGMDSEITPATSLDLSPGQSKTDLGVGNTSESTPRGSQEGGKSSEVHESSGQEEPPSTMPQTSSKDEDQPENSRDDDQDGLSDGYGTDGTSITDPMESISPARRQRLISRRAQQHAQHLQLTEDRIRSLEARLEALQPRSPSPAPSAPEPREVLATSELRFVDWETWRRDSNLGNQGHAIDVLVGEPVLFHQIRSKTEKSQRQEPNEEKPSESEEDHLPLKAIPNRIRINSSPLAAVLKRVIRGSFRETTDPFVVLRPYKPLVYHAEDLREDLARMELKWGVSSDQRIDSRPGSPVGGDSSNVSDNSGKSIDDSPQALAELRCLVRFVDAISPLIDQIRHIHKPVDNAVLKDCRILFKDLWYIFKPGQHVYSGSNYQRVWRVTQVTGGRQYLSTEFASDPIDGPRVRKVSPFSIDCYYIDFDGKRFGAVHHKFEIESFDDLRSVTSLDVFPVEYLRDSDTVMRHATERGKKFTEATHVSHRYFKGRTLIFTPNGEKVLNNLDDRPIHAEDVESPVMVDFDRTLHFNSGWTPDFDFPDFAEQDIRETREMKINQEVGDSGGKRHCLEIGCCGNEAILSDFEWDRRRMDEFVSKDDILSLNGMTHEYKISEEDYKLCPGRVFGFILRSRKWACLPLDSLKEVGKDRSNFDSLELRDDHKGIVEGLVETHFRNREKEKTAVDDTAPEFDLVRAKGKGLVILLHGAPGVGKTSTAECVAESNGQPLFPITCGDLGVQPIEVERGLDFNFQLAESWGCVLLLDEADVFLAQRSARDIERNALVSIFLRALEYYSGILFLTTNRVASIDEAFRSRIHMSLLYRTLNEMQTMRIWQGQLQRAQRRNSSLLMNTDEILKYVNVLYKQQMAHRKIAWNGRQIRNAMKTAVSLAEYDSVMASTRSAAPVQPYLQTKWIELVANASLEFESYIESTREIRNSAEYTKLHLRRNDDWEPQNSSMLPMPNASNVWQSGSWESVLSPNSHVQSTMFAPQGPLFGERAQQSLPQAPASMFSGGNPASSPTQWMQQAQPQHTEMATTIAHMPSSQTLSTVPPHQHQMGTFPGAATNAGATAISKASYGNAAQAAQPSQLSFSGHFQNQPPAPQHYAQPSAASTAANTIGPPSQAVYPTGQPGVVGNPLVYQVAPPHASTTAQPGVVLQSGQGPMNSSAPN